MHLKKLVFWYLPAPSAYFRMLGPIEGIQQAVDGTSPYCEAAHHLQESTHLAQNIMQTPLNAPVEQRFDLNAKQSEMSHHFAAKRAERARTSLNGGDDHATNHCHRRQQLRVVHFSTNTMVLGVRDISARMGSTGTEPLPPTQHSHQQARRRRS